MPVIGITGTNGKTTCSQLLAQAFSHFQTSCGVVGTLGYGLFQDNKFLYEQQNECQQARGMTTPGAIVTQSICAELLDKGARNIVMEVSSHGLAQYRVAAIDIRTAIFTNLSHDHLDYHGDMESYGAVKAKLFAMPSVSTAIINQDDPYAKQIISGLEPSVQVVTYSLYNQVSIDASSFTHFSLANIQVDACSMRAQIVMQHSQQVIDIKTKLVGHFNLSNLLAVIAALYINRYDVEKIAEVVPLLSPVPGRMELLANELGFRVVVDYAHTPDALQSALEALTPCVNGRLWCIFGCGGDRDRQKRPQMSAIAERFADKVIVTNDNPRNESPEQILADIENGFTLNNDSQKYEIIADRASAIEYAVNQAVAGDTILISGKGHESYQLIGNERCPFSDQKQARFSLRQRETREIKETKEITGELE